MHNTSYFMYNTLVEYRMRFSGQLFGFPNPLTITMKLLKLKRYLPSILKYIYVTDNHIYYTSISICITQCITSNQVTWFTKSLDITKQFHVNSSINESLDITKQFLPNSPITIS